MNLFLMRNILEVINNDNKEIFKHLKSEYIGCSGNIKFKKY